MTRKLSSAIQAVVFTGAALCAACDQPAPKCSITGGAFWAKYTLVEGEGACAELKGEELDIQSYYAPRSSSNSQPDFEQVSIGIQPWAITAALGGAADLAEPDPEDKPYAFGSLSTKTPSGDFCLAPTLSAARVRLPVIPEHAVDECTTAPETPATDLSYEFTNVRIYFTASAIGTQLEADLTYRQDGCVATYKVSAITPMVHCDAVPTPEDGAEEAPAEDEEEAPAELCPDAPAETEPPTPDDTLCENAGIDPDYALACDPDTFMCVLKNSSPSLK